MVIALAAATSALADSWCAAPLVVHEWGVAKLRADGRAAVAEPLPSWFHRDPPSGGVPVEPVRDLPPDNGIRTLPVVQLYAPSGREAIPAALDVGFAHGDPLVWFPQVDEHRTGARARSPVALAGRAALVSARVARKPFAPVEPLGADPTRQLGWDALTLSRTPGTLQPAELPWVEALRQMPGALWVGRGAESDRFVFYEGTTRERPAVVLEAGDRGRPDAPHVLLRNVSDWTVHDVVLIANGRAVTVPAIPPGRTAGFLLEPRADRAALRDWLRSRWVDADQPEPPASWSMDQGECVMMRDPAVPVDRASGHRLYGAEVDLLLDVWEEAMLGAGPPRILYREDTAALDAQMPLAAYTDMHAYPELRRLGVVLVEGVVLP